MLAEGVDGDGEESEDAIALAAVQAWTDADADDDLDEARREAMAAIAQEALALKERREARERREAEARRAAERKRRWTERAQDAERARESVRRAAARAQGGHAVTTDRADAHAELERKKDEEPAARHEARVDADARARDGRLAAVERVQAQRRETGRRGDGARLEPERRRREKSPVNEASRAGVPGDRGDLLAIADVYHNAVFDAARAKLSDVDNSDNGLHAIPERGDAADAAERPAGSTPEPDDDLPPLIGADLRRWRSLQGLTQQAAANSLGVRQGTRSKAEGRASGVLGPALRRALAKALGPGGRSA
jgi:hypothetical protein